VRGATPLTSPAQRQSRTPEQKVRHIWRYVEACGHAKVQRTPHYTTSEGPRRAHTLDEPRAFCNIELVVRKGLGQWWWWYWRGVVQRQAHRRTTLV